MTKISSKAISFSLMHWFSILSLVSIVMVGSVSAVVLARFLSDQILRRDAIVTMEFIERIVQAANAKHAGEPPANHVHLGPPKSMHPMTAIDHYMAGHRGKLTGHDHDADAELWKFFELIGQMPNVLRANFYAVDRSVIFSTADELVGARFRDNPELEGAFSGELIALEHVAGTSRKAEHVVFAEPSLRYIENYLPIWTDDRTIVVGVVEIYKSSRSLLEAIDKGRQLVWMSAALAGSFLYIVLFWIVHRANTTIQRQQSRLLESETLATIGEMSAAVAHNIRNPLAAIRACVELTLETNSWPTAKEAARDAIVEVDRLGQRIREMLTFSRFESGEMTPVSLSETAKEALDGFAQVAEKQGVTLDWAVDECLPPIQGDKAILEQIFRSVISNAVEAMPVGGRLCVFACKAGGVVEVSIADTGIGISEAGMSDIFKPFFTSKSQGLGLGLPLARRLVERLGGEISVTSQAQHGTTVKLHFPVFSG